MSTWKSVKPNWYPRILSYHHIILSFKVLFCFYCSWYFCVCLGWGGMTFILNRNCGTKWHFTLSMNHHIPICPASGKFSLPVCLHLEFCQVNYSKQVLLWSSWFLLPVLFAVARFNSPSSSRSWRIRVARSRCFQDLNLVCANHLLNDVYPVTDLLNFSLTNHRHTSEILQIWF